MNEYHIKLEIAPETYDYGEDEIAYRVYVYRIPDKNTSQLISERTLPLLQNNQKIVENISYNAILIPYENEHNFQKQNKYDQTPDWLRRLC